MSEKILSELIRLQRIFAECDDSGISRLSRQELLNWEQLAKSLEERIPNTRKEWKQMDFFKPFKR